jgi:hypothetical protein
MPKWHEAASCNLALSRFESDPVLHPGVSFNGSGRSSPERVIGVRILVRPPNSSKTTRGPRFRRLPRFAATLERPISASAMSRASTSKARPSPQSAIFGRVRAAESIRRNRCEARDDRARCDHLPGVQVVDECSLSGTLYVVASAARNTTTRAALVAATGSPHQRFTSDARCTLARRARRSASHTTRLRCTSR